MLCTELRLEKDRPTWLSQRKDEPVFLNKTKAPPPKKKYKWVMNKQTPSVRHTCKREPHLIALVPRKKGKKNKQLKDASQIAVLHCIPVCNRQRRLWTRMAASISEWLCKHKETIRADYFFLLLLEDVCANNRREQGPDVIVEERC